MGIYDAEAGALGIVFIVLGARLVLRPVRQSGARPAHKRSWLFIAAGSFLLMLGTFVLVSAWFAST